MSPAVFSHQSITQLISMMTSTTPNSDLPASLRSSGGAHAAELRDVKLRFPYELITKIVKRLVFVDDIDTLRILSKFRIESIQQALDDHIVTVVINQRYDPLDPHNTDPNTVPNHGQSLSRTKIYPEIPLNVRIEQHYRALEIIEEAKSNRLKAAFTSKQNHKRDSVSIDDYHNFNYPSAKKRCLITNWPPEFRLTPDDILKARRTARMFILEIHTNRNTCLKCDKALADSFCAYFIDRMARLRKPCGPHIIFFNSFYHVQLFKVLPNDLNDCDILGQTAHSWYANLTRDGFLPVNWDEITEPIMPLRLTRSFQVDVQTARKQLGHELIVECPNGTFDLMLKDKDGVEETIGNVYVPPPCSDIRGGGFSTIDAFFYINRDTLRGSSNAISNKNSPPITLEKKIDDILRLTEYELSKPRQKIRKFIAAIYSSILNSEGHGSPRKRYNALNLARGQKVLKLLVEFAACQIYNTPTSDQNGLQRGASCKLDQQAHPAYTYDSNTQFVCLGRFQVYRSVSNASAKLKLVQQRELSIIYKILDGKLIKIESNQSLISYKTYLFIDRKFHRRIMQDYPEKIEILGRLLMHYPCWSEGDDGKITYRKIYRPNTSCGIHCSNDRHYNYN